jgi:two-component system chemotaxis sensor kinase CheA
MPSDPYRYFRVEARDLLDQLGRSVLELESGSGAPDVVARLLRLAHTLKGAARVVKAREIADRAHAIEDALAPFRQGGIAMPRDCVNAVLTMLDEISDQTAALGPPPDAGTGSAPRRPVQEEAPRILRADVEEMDALLDGVVEASTQLAALRRNSTELARARRLTELLDDDLSSTRDQRPLNGATPKIRSMAAELRSVIMGLERGLAGGVEQMDRELRQVREAAERLRLLPASLMFGTLERTARDAAQSLGKRLAFVPRGVEVRLDAHVISVVQHALVQVVRNAVAHGIESEAEREAAGKTPDGRLSLEIQRRGNRVAFICRDDGAGVDLEAVRRAAQRKGVLFADIQRLGAEELLRLLLRGGLTTSGTTTEIAGRGIGLDIVREAASRLGGEVRVQTGKGIGTTFELVVPVSLSSLEVLVVEAAGRTAAIPLGSVKRTVRLVHGDLSETAEGASVLFEGRAIPFVALERALRIDAGRSDGARPRSAVVVEGSNALCALGVERLRGTEAIVVQPLPDLAPVDPVVAGASLDAEGNPRLVLEPEGLVKEALRKEPISRRAATVRPPILVIDDSLTTRMLEQSILESGGYDVDLATSGEEALEKAMKRPYSIFLVDVEMPGIDGFEFIERTRSDPVLREVPAVLVTSRTSPEDRQRAEHLGAAAYIVKSEFDQTELLDRIRRLVAAR